MISTAALLGVTRVTTSSQTEAQLGALISAKYLPADDAYFTAAIVNGGAVIGSSAGGWICGAIGSAFGPVGCYAGIVIGRKAGAWAGAL